MPIREGRDSQGRRYMQEWGYLVKAKGKRLYVRRITLSREGEKDVVLVTNLLDADRYPAVDLVDGYCLTWGIERVFQQVTEVFHLRQLISSTPEGRFSNWDSYGCVLQPDSSRTQLHRRCAQRKPAESISVEELFYDVHRELISLSTLVDASQIVAHFQPAATALELQNVSWETLSIRMGRPLAEITAEKHTEINCPQKNHQRGPHIDLSHPSHGEAKVRQRCLKQELRPPIGWFNPAYPKRPPM